jgi:hypothetical protein
MGAEPISKPRRRLAILSVVTVLGIVAASPSHAAAETTITVFPAAPQLNNCWPFGLASGGLTWGPHLAFIYRNIPAFELKAGDRVAFDTHAPNDTDIGLHIAMARTTVNGGTQEAQPFETVVTNGQTPAAPRGDSTMGNFDLAFTAEAPFSFPGGGLIVRFSNPSPVYAADNFCNGNLVGANSSDTTGQFVLRTFNDADGGFPWTGANTGDIGAIQLTLLDPPPSDTTPPDTAITKGPKDKTKKKRATFEFSGTDARAVAGFECSLDGAVFAACSTPLTVKVKKGKHTFEVRATDAAGNVDGSPATDGWKVKKKKKKQKK